MTWKKISDGLKVSLGLYIIVNMMPILFSALNFSPWNQFVVKSFPDSIYMQTMYVEGILIVAFATLVALVCIIRWCLKPLN